jgi:hypothetical protein
MKTIVQIREEFGAKSAAILNDYQEELAEVKAMRTPSDGAYLDRLSGDQRMGLLREQKTEQATSLTEQASKAYTEEVEAYHAAIAKRADYIREHLFKVEDAGALSRAATATDAELGAMLEIAALSQNAELGRAVFVAAEQRGLGDLMAAYFDKINPEGRELYAEWSEVPPQEILERQLQNVGAILPDVSADSLMAPATLGRF